MDYDYQLIQISPKFFGKYPNPPYKEILGNGAGILGNSITEMKATR